MNGKWISIDDEMPEEGIRVWASTGSMDVGHDCFYGLKSCTHGEAVEKGYFDFGCRCWRRTETEEPVPNEIRYWMHLPDSPSFDD